MEPGGHNPSRIGVVGGLGPAPRDSSRSYTTLTSTLVERCFSWSEIVTVENANVDADPALRLHRPALQQG